MKLYWLLTCCTFCHKSTHACRANAVLSSSLLSRSEYEDVQCAAMTTLACTLHAMPTAARMHAVRRLAQNIPEAPNDAAPSSPQAVATGDRAQLLRAAAALLQALCHTSQQAWRSDSVAAGACGYKGGRDTYQGQQDLSGESAASAGTVDVVWGQSASTGGLLLENPPPACMTSSSTSYIAAVQFLCLFCLVFTLHCSTVIEGELSTY